MELLKKLGKDEGVEKIKCNRCQRKFDPNEDILYFLSVTDQEFEENKGFFVCFECRDHFDDAKMEQII